MGGASTDEWVRDVNSSFIYMTHFSLIKERNPDIRDTVWVH